jgi:putative Holliday junction resolvase
VKAIAAIVRENAITEVVVGHPVALSGQRGEAAHHAERFADALRAALGIPVALQDERLTTVEADRGLAKAGVRGRHRRDVVDQAAAALILQAYLDGSRSRGGLGRGPE